MLTSDVAWALSWPGALSCHHLAMTGAVSSREEHRAQFRRRMVLLAHVSIVIAAAAACGSTHPDYVPSSTSSGTKPPSEVLPRFATTAPPKGPLRPGFNYGVSNGHFYLVRTGHR